MQDLNISSQNKTVELVSGYPLYVRAPKGKLINLDASPEETVSTLNSCLAFWEGMPLKQQRLMFIGQAMDDNFTLKHCNLPRGGVNKMDKYIRKPDGDTVMVKPHPNPEP